MGFEPTTYCRECNEPFDVYREPGNRLCDGCADELSTELFDLIARLEGATCGSRELDADIGRFVGTWDCAETSKRHYRHEFLSAACDIVFPPSYTTSLDAALTLVPSRLGIMWDVAKYPGESAAAYVGQRDVPMRKFVPAKTPALALCIACLRAKESSNG